MQHFAQPAGSQILQCQLVRLVVTGCKWRKLQAVEAGPSAGGRAGGPELERHAPLLLAPRTAPQAGSPGLASAAVDAGWSSGCACSSASCRSVNALTCSSMVPAGQRAGRLCGSKHGGQAAGPGGSAGELQCRCTSHAVPIPPMSCSAMTCHLHPPRSPAHTLHDQPCHCQPLVLTHAVAAPDRLPLEAGVERGLAQAATGRERALLGRSQGLQTNPRGYCEKSRHASSAAQQAADRCLCMSVCQPHMMCVAAVRVMPAPPALHGTGNGRSMGQADQTVVIKRQPRLLQMPVLRNTAATLVRTLSKARPPA